MLTKTVTDLFNKVYQRRMRLRLIGIRFSGLVRGTYQINLFEDTEEMLSLYQAMDKMKSRYGFDAVMRCAGPGGRRSGCPFHTACCITVPLGEK